jgi:hypothetical protein
MSAYGAGIIYYKSHDFPDATIDATIEPAVHQGAIRAQQVAPCRGLVSSEAQVRHTMLAQASSHVPARNEWHRVCKNNSGFMSFELNQRKHFEDELTTIVRREAFARWIRTSSMKRRPRQTAAA